MSTTGFPSPAMADSQAGESSGPSPSTPTSSTPWGSTSTAPGTPQWTSTPLSAADAPTSSVPLVQGVAGTGATPPPRLPGTDTSDPRRAARARGPRRARLQLRHINPWTVLKFSCVLSIALFFVWLIVVGVLFGVLDGAGVINKINDAYTTIQGGDAKAPVTAGVVFGGAAIIGVVNIVLFIALTTVGSVVYNLCADLVGGIEITLSER
jgi:hypothetical protein